MSLDTVWRILIGMWLAVALIFVGPGFFSAAVVKALLVIILPALLIFLSAKLNKYGIAVLFVIIAVLGGFLFYIPGKQFGIPDIDIPTEF